MIEIVAPCLISAKCVGVSKYEEGVFGPRYCYVHSFFVVDKADNPFRIRTNAADNNHIDLLALKGVHSTNPNLISLFLAHRNLVNLGLNIFNL